MKKMFCRLAVLMAERDPGLSQRKLAEDLKLSTTTVNRIFNNEFERIDVHTVEKLCDYFGCTPGDLLVLRDQEKKS
jgi:putative transcriptional regulator